MPGAKGGNPNWVKGGPSPNPNGRPSTPPEVKEALAAMTKPAVARLAELLESTDEKVVMSAIKEVLDRNLGKPVQPTDAKVEVTNPPAWDLSKLSEAELRVMKDLAAKAVAVGGNVKPAD